MTTTEHESQLTGKLVDAVDLLMNLLRRVEQCEHVCFEELERLEDPNLDLMNVRRAITILREDLEDVQQQCIDRGLLKADGTVALHFEIETPAAPTGGAP